MERYPSILRELVREAYSKAAAHPGERHPFPVGRDFAVSLGYPDEILSRLPDACTGGFTGVSNVAIFAELTAGSTVLDLGCGSGLDSLIAAGRVGPAGRVLGFDFSDAMLGRANAARRQLGAANVHFAAAAAERLPLADASIHHALVNGIFNLNPHRAAIFRELARVVKPGGAVWGAELVLRAELKQKSPPGLADWFS